MAKITEAKMRATAKLFAENRDGTPKSRKFKGGLFSVVVTNGKLKCLYKSRPITRNPDSSQLSMVARHSVLIRINNASEIVAI
jgi:hypothetical protein